MVLVLLLLAWVFQTLARLTLEENDEIQAMCGQFYLNNISNVHRSMNTENTTRFEAPFAVMLRNSIGSESSNFTCSGTLISKRHVVTAAHCLRQFVGCQNSLIQPNFAVDTLILTPMVCKYMNNCDTTLPQQAIIVAKAFYLKDYLKTKCTNFSRIADLTVYELSEDVIFSDTIQPACLATKLPQWNSPITMFGFGAQNRQSFNNAILRKLPSRLVDREECLAYKRFNEVHRSKKLGRDEICSRDKRGLACHGDSGSGYYFIENNRAYLIGVLSKGIMCNVDQLEEDDLMDFSADTTYYHEWICAVSGVCPGQLAYEINPKLYQYSQMHFTFYQQ